MISNGALKKTHEIVVRGVSVEGKERWMDLSETYIRMCEKAPNLKDGWANGDLYTQRIDFGGFDKVRICLSDGREPEFPDEIIRVYRQDELQGLLSRNDQLDITSFDDMGWPDCLFQDGGKRTGSSWEPYEKFMQGELSWEQIWLRLVMDKKFKKVWNGEDWVKEE